MFISRIIILIDFCRISNHKFPVPNFKNEWRTHNWSWDTRYNNLNLSYFWKFLSQNQILITTQIIKNRLIDLFCYRTNHWFSKPICTGSCFVFYLRKKTHWGCRLWFLGGVLIFFKKCVNIRQAVFVYFNQEQIGNFSTFYDFWNLIFFSKLFLATELFFKTL